MKKFRWTIFFLTILTISEMAAHFFSDTGMGGYSGSMIVLWVLYGLYKLAD